MAAPAAVFRHFQPSPELRPYVCGYMWFTLEGEEPERTQERFFPDGSSETRFNSADPLLNHMLPCPYASITFNFGDPWKVKGSKPGLQTLRRTWAMGASTRPGIVEFGRRAEAFGAMFHAGQAQLFLGMPAESLTDEIAALDNLWGPGARSLEAQLGELPTIAARIRALEKELLRRVRAARRVEGSVQPIASLIERERGAVSVKWLSQASGISRQHLARKFRQQIGLSPKQFCRFARFHAVVSHAYYRPRVDWAGVAAEFGYYDQAHLIAEFKEFTGLTPSQFFHRPSDYTTALAAD